MGRMSLTVDEGLVEEARAALGVPTKAAAIRKALTEVLRRKRLAEALGHQARVGLDLDQKALRKGRGQG